MYNYSISKFLSHAAVPVLAAVVFTGQPTNRHGLHHAKHYLETPKAAQKTWEDSEDDGWYHRPISPGLHEEFGS
jgi:hypothetical protein